MTNLLDMRPPVAEHRQAGPAAKVQAADVLPALLPADGSGIGRLDRLLAEQRHRLSPSAYDRLRADLIAQGTANTKRHISFMGVSLLCSPHPSVIAWALSESGYEPERVARSGARLGRWCAPTDHSPSPESGYVRPPVGNRLFPARSSPGATPLMSSHQSGKQVRISADQHSSCTPSWTGTAGWGASGRP